MAFGLMHLDKQRQSLVFTITIGLCFLFVVMSFFRLSPIGLLAGFLKGIILLPSYCS